MNGSLGGSASLAVLIDADNADPAIVERLLGEISKFGVASAKRIYGDWTSPNLGRWKEALLGHSIQPIQQFAYTSGKNATDSALIIDAMDLLHLGTFDGFCLVSSDSDFTRLAARLRESGKLVLGFGEEKTPRPFVTACDQFIYTEVFKVPVGEAPPVSTRTPTRELKKDTQLVGLLRSAIAAASGEDGWAALSAVGSFVVKQKPDFDSRHYGYAKLSDLVGALDLFAVARTGGGVRVSAQRKRSAPNVGAATKKSAAKAQPTKKTAARTASGSGIP